MTLLHKHFKSVSLLEKIINSAILVRFMSFVLYFNDSIYYFLFITLDIFRVYFNLACFSNFCVLFFHYVFNTI